MIGETISHYKIIEQIGEGGMGVVYKAEDTKLKRTVALKFLPRELIRDQESRARFVQEAQAAASLNSPNIVTIHEIDEHRGDIYIAMEYVEGQTLKEKITDDSVSLDTRKRISAGERRVMPLEIGAVVDIASQVCKGLSAAHKVGIVHRDIKPHNIIINEEGVVKILDFGVAKLTRETNITKEMSTVGTPHYIPPEVLTGKGADQRVDLWALGVVLYEMLTAELPFYAENVQSVLYAIVNEPPIPPSDISDDISRELERITLKCLRKDRDERYQSAEELLDDLRKFARSLRGESSEIRVKKTLEKKETERRHATLISAEITGYDEMISSMDAEEVAAVMSECFDMFHAVVTKNEGWIDKITANSFMVLFGVPNAVENAPKKSVQTALEMRSQLAQFNKKKKLPAPLNIRIGINTGIVIAGILGKDEKKYSVIGEAVNLVNQLKETAEEGYIYVGTLTHKYTKYDYQYKELKPQTFKGKKKAVAAYELLAPKEKGDRARPGADRMIHAKLVGREKELDKLQLHLMKVINGEGSIISIVGEAGIGKSRLVAEMRTQEAAKRVTFLAGRALSMGKNISFHPFTATIKNWAGIEEKDSAPEAYNKLEKAVKTACAGESGEIFPFIATLMGMKLSGAYARRIEGIEGEAMERLIKKNFRELVVYIARQKPLVFLLEDLHWADRTSIELLESLVRLSLKDRILFIFLLRPGYEETGERLLTAIKERCGKLSAEIHLEALDRDHSKRLIAGLLKVKDLKESVLELITKRAGGNPYFIEEVIRSFIDDGVVELKNGSFKVTEKIDSVEIPGSINDVLMGRIDKLDAETRSLLKTGAVIGRGFFHKILSAVAESVQDIDDKLAYLEEVQLLQERVRMGEIEFVFKNTLIQEAAYESLLLKKRKELHRRVAAAIEKVFAGKLREFYGMLALHYNQGEDHDKAEMYLTKAGEEAMKSAASSEALHYYQEALKLYLKKYGDSGDPEKIANLEKNIALAHYNKGHFIEAVEHFDKVLELWGEKPPSQSKLKVNLDLLLNLSSTLKTLHTPFKGSKKKPPPRINDIVDITHKRATALATVDNYRMFVDSIGLLRKLNNLDLTTVEKGPSMYIQSSILFGFAGISFKIARDLLEYPKEYLETGGKKAAIEYKFANLPLCVYSGEWSEDLVYDREVVDYNIRIGDIWTAIVYLLWSGKLQTELGKFADAQKTVDMMRDVAEVYDHDYGRVRHHSVNTRLLLIRRRLDEALVDVEAGITLSGSVGESINILNFLGLKANIQALRGDIAGAEESLLQAGEIVSREKRIAPWHISSFHLSRFLLDIFHLEEGLKVGDKSKAEEYRKKANRSSKDAVTTAAKFAPNRTETYKLVGTYYWMSGSRKKALDWWEKSVRTGERLKALPELARAYLEIGRRLTAEGSEVRELAGVPAETYLEKAQAIFDKINLPALP